MRHTITTLLLLLSLSTGLWAQTPANKSMLTIDQIMQGERFTGFWPENAFWGEDNKTIYFSWNPTRDTLRRLYKITTEGAAPEAVSDTEQRQLITGGTNNRDFTQKVFSRNGDLFLLDLKTGQTTAITNTLEYESNPRFAADQNIIIFSRGSNLFTWNRTTGGTTQLTDFRSGSEQKDKPLTTAEEWLKKDQLEWFEVLDWRKGQREIRERQSKAQEPKRPKTYWSGAKSISNVQASPDLRFVTFTLVKRAEGKRTDVPNYVTESGYTEDLPARSKVGSPQDTYELGIYDLERDTIYFPETKDLPGIYDKPAFLQDYHKGPEPYKNTFNKPREVAYNGPVYSDDSQVFFVLRSQDNKDRWIALLDLPSGQWKVLERQRDEAWVGGPGVGWGGGLGNAGWMPDNRRIWFQSEETGFSQLYTVDVQSGVKKALTQGQFEIYEVRLSRDKSAFYLTANAEGPHERHFYRLPAEGGQLEKLTGMTGNNEVSMSPDERYLAIRYSYSNKPWELYLMENKAGAIARQLTQSATPEFRKYSWRDPEIVWFTARDGVRVPARLYRPAKGGKGGPAVIFVHGAGYLQNVHKWWSNYFREFMFHNFLADNGYTVLDIDYRASEGYGRDWRTAIYRHMGGKDLDDQVDGAKFLASQYGVNAKKIGIYGGSYGGFITLMALFNAPETFRSGAALRAVTDWAHYNHGYTSNILNTPAEDSIAYRRSSPIYFAEGLKNDLLILHGMVDVNVHFQDVVRLAQRLIELKKERWEFAVFPLEDHGFVEPSSWADEYRRIYKLFEETLK